MITLIILPAGDNWNRRTGAQTVKGGPRAVPQGS
jgi:hypothetical protein